MFTSSTIQKIDRKFFHRLRLQSDTNQYIYAGHDNIYVQSDLGYFIYGEFHIPRYFRNVFPYSRNCTSQVLDFRYYPGNINQSWVALWTDIASDNIFGYHLSEAVHFVYYDTVTRTLYTELGNVYNYPINEAEILYVSQKHLSTTNFIWLVNGITYQTYHPYYETVYNPFELNISTKALYKNVLSKGRTVPFKPITSLTGINLDYEIRQPKVLAWFNDKYYTYSTATKFTEVTPSSPPYLTLNELEASGITIEQLNNIPDADWISLLNDHDELYILTNGYYLPVLVEHRFWMDQYDMMQFIWRFSKEYKACFLVGDI